MFLLLVITIIAALRQRTPNSTPAAGDGGMIALCPQHLAPAVRVPLYALHLLHTSSCPSCTPATSLHFLHLLQLLLHLLRTPACLHPYTPKFLNSLHCTSSCNPTPLHTSHMHLLYNKNTCTRHLHTSPPAPPVPAHLHTCTHTCTSCTCTPASLHRSTPTPLHSSYILHPALLHFLRPHAHLHPCTSCTFFCTFVSTYTPARLHRPRPLNS